MFCSVVLASGNFCFMTRYTVNLVDVSFGLLDCSRNKLFNHISSKSSYSVNFYDYNLWFRCIYFSFTRGIGFNLLFYVHNFKIEAIISIEHLFCFYFLIGYAVDISYQIEKTSVLKVNQS